MLSTRARLWLLFKGALYLLVLATLIQMLRGLLPNPTSAAVIGAVLVSLAASRLGMDGADTDGADTDGADTGVPWRDVLRAALVPSAIAAVALLAVLAGGARWHFRAPGLSLLFTFAEVVAISYRDELWLRGMPLYVGRRAGIDDRLITAYSVALAVGAVLLLRGTGWQGCLLTAASALFFALRWRCNDHRWLVVAGHAAWLLWADGLFAGELLRIGKEAGRLSGGATATGVFAWVASIGFLAAAAWIWRTLNQQGGDGV